MQLQFQEDAARLLLWQLMALPMHGDQTAEDDSGTAPQQIGKVPSRFHYLTAEHSLESVRHRLTHWPLPVTDLSMDGVVTQTGN